MPLGISVVGALCAALLGFGCFKAVRLVSQIKAYKEGTKAVNVTLPADFLALQGVPLGGATKDEAKRVATALVAPAVKFGGDHEAHAPTGFGRPDAEVSALSTKAPAGTAVARRTAVAAHHHRRRARRRSGDAKGGGGASTPRHRTRRHPARVGCWERLRWGFV